MIISGIVLVALIAFLVIWYMKKKKAPASIGEADLTTVKEYITKSRALKYEDAYIRTLLKNNEWSDNLIDKAFEELK